MRPLLISAPTFKNRWLFITFAPPSRFNNYSLMYLLRNIWWKLSLLMGLKDF